MSRMSLPPLQDRIAQLDGSYEDFDPIFRLADLTTPAMHFVRIASLPRTGGAPPSFFPFVRGLWSLQLPWAMLATGRPGDTRLYIGSLAADVKWPTVLESTLSGSEIVNVPDAHEITAAISTLPAVGVITGNPCIETEDDQPLSSPIQFLAGSLPSAPWAYIVFAKPISEASILQSLRSLQRERREVASDFQRRASAEDGNHPTAQRLISLLTAAQKQHELGSQVGMWKLAAGILATSKGDLATAAHAALSALARGDSTPQPIRCIRIGATSPCALTSLNSRESSAYVALPHIELPGLRAIDPVRFSVNPPQTHSEHRVACGVILDQHRRTPNWFEVDRNDLSRHIFVCGATGSGKTRTSQSILVQLWAEHHVPFLVIEPAMKSEYRALLSSECGRDLRIYTPGRPNVSPFFLNPLERPAHVNIETHVDSLVGLFSAAMGLFPPMPHVLRLGLQQLFQTVDCPTLRELQTVVREMILRLGYQGEIGANMRAALDLRLQVMNSGIVGQTFNVRASTPVDDWSTYPTIIELSPLGDDATRALMMGALLLRLVQTRQSQGLTSVLRHVVAIEEAHRLLRRQMPRGEVVDAGEHAAESFAQILAEVRAFGQSLMVVDQSPSKLIPDVIRNAQLKIVHRLTASDDQSAVGAAMALNDSQQRSLAALRVGEAIAFSPRSTEPCKIAIPDRLRAMREQLQVLPDDAKIAALMRPLLPTAPSVNATTCARCPDEGQCELGRIVRRHLLDHDEAEAIAAAFSQDLDTVRSFGARVVSDLRLPSSPQTIRCVILQVARAISTPDAAISQLRDRLG